MTAALPLPYVGTAPYGSCYSQCVANLAAWNGLRDAASVLHLAWGFSWRGDHALDGSNRWRAGAMHAHGLEIVDESYGTASEARVAERNVPVAAAVDAYYLPSPYFNIEHLGHCVILIGNDADQVTVLDPMYQPHPARHARDQWDRMRSGAGYRTFRIASGPRRAASRGVCVDTVRADLRAHWQSDLAVFEKYLAARQELLPELPDVAGAAAERLYLSKLFRHLKLELSEDMLAITRRWYLAHAMFREAGLAKDRDLRLLRELAERETAMTDAFCRPGGAAW